MKFEFFKNEQETPEQIFAREKREAFDFVVNSESDPTEIDIGIRPLVEKLNTLPFVFTTTVGSCEGHPKIGEEKAKYQPGYIHFQIDNSPESIAFLEDIKKVLEHYPHEITKMEREMYGGSILPGGYYVQFGDHTKKNGIFPKEDVIKWDAEEKELIKELEGIADKYIEEGNKKIWG